MAEYMIEERMCLWKACNIKIAEAMKEKENVYGRREMLKLLDLW